VAISKRLRFEILKRDGFRCHYCGVTACGSALEVDHVIPVSEGGSDEAVNLITSCAACNRGKSDNLIDQPAIEGKRGKLTSGALAKAKATGAILGGAALGMKRLHALDHKGRRQVVCDQREMASVRRILELHSQGLGYKAIAEQMKAEGHPTKRGGRWHGSTVAAILRRFPDKQMPLPLMDIS
jgi:hypothetical protein